ncbi:F-box/LRR-repeat protein [Balamuthia mandrillaris]
MQELNSLTARLAEQEQKLLFFAPLSPDLRKRLREHGLHRDRELRKLFAQQLWSGVAAAPAMEERATTAGVGGEIPAVGLASEVDRAWMAHELPQRGNVQDISCGRGDAMEEEEEARPENLHHSQNYDCRIDLSCVVALPELPNELWAHVISFIPQEQMLRNVAGVNWTFHKLSIASIYKARVWNHCRHSDLTAALQDLTDKLTFLQTQCRTSLTVLDLHGWQDVALGRPEVASDVLKTLHRAITDLPHTFPALRSLSLSRTATEPSCLVHFSRFNYLHTLSLRHCVKNDDESLTLLPTSLTKLNLSALPITDEGMQLLPPKLISLDLSECKFITPQGFRYLSEHLPHTLVNLELHYFNLNEHHLAAMPSTLTSLSWSTSAFSPTMRGFQHLPRCLTHLGLCNPQTGYIPNFPTSLTSLSLLYCDKLSPADFGSLSAFSSLTRLSLTRCPELDDSESLSFLVHLTQLRQLALSRFLGITGIFFDWLPPSLQKLKVLYAYNQVKSCNSAAPLP